MSENDAGVVITAINFAEDGINIQYAEAREMTHVASVARSIVIDLEYVQEEVDELLEMAREVVDRGLLLLRNPPKRLRQGKRLLDELGPDEATERAAGVAEDLA